MANGVKELQILNREQILEMEPNISDNVYAALYAPTAGIVCPFGLNIAMAENACENGVEFRFNTEVQNIRKIDRGWALDTNNGVYETKYVVNAAGVYADKFHNMVSEKKIHITPRRGDYCLLDKKDRKTCFQDNICAAHQIRKGRSRDTYDPRQSPGRPDRHRC